MDQDKLGYSSQNLSSADNHKLGSNPTIGDTSANLPLSNYSGRKQKNSHKWMPILLILVLVIIGLVAFGFWWKGGKTDVSKKVTITYWTVKESKEVIKPLLDQFMKENPNIIVNLVINSDIEYRQRLSNNLAKDNPDVDLFRFHNTWVPMMGRFLVPIPESVFPKKIYQATFYPVVMRDLKLGNSYAGIPLNFDGLSLFYNVDIFRLSNVEPPTDWTSFPAVYKKLTVRDSNKNLVIGGVGMGNVDNVDHWQDLLAVMILQNGANIKNPTNSLTKNAISVFLAPAKAKVWDATMPDSTTAFATGRLAMYFGLARDIPRIKKIADDNGYNLNFRTMPIPQLLQKNVTWASYWVEGVSNKSTPEKQMAAWKLLKYLSSKDVMEQRYHLQTSILGSGLPFSRKEMSDQLATHPLLGSFVVQAPSSYSWYLVSDTTDTEGINDKIGKVYKGVLSELSRGKPGKITKESAGKINEILKSYSK